MFECIHISPKRNFDSIKKNGIFRRSPLLSQYNEIMEENYADLYDPKKGLVFAFSASTSKVDKYIKDFLYWKGYGDQRNKILNTFDYETFEKYKDKGSEIFKKLKFVEESYSIFLLKIPYEEMFSYYFHVQTHDMSEYWTDMQAEYEHYNKPLTLINYDVDASSIKCIGEAKATLNKRGLVETTVNIRRAYV